MKIYTIKKGNHSPFRLPAFTTSDAIEYTVKFDETAIYQTKDPVNQYDINKLFGLSDGLNHEYQSARFGWRYMPDKGMVELWSYCYISGERSVEFLRNIPINTWHKLTIEMNEDNYYFFINSNGCYREKIKLRKPNNLKYKLFPYFGGDETAPHDINIYFK